MLRRPNDVLFLELCGLAAAVCPPEALKRPRAPVLVIRLPEGLSEGERAAWRNLWGTPRSRFEALLP